jgi:hypothetical protein
MISETQIFQTRGFDVGLAYHNIQNVVRGASREVQQKIASHYGKRAGHIPDVVNHIGVLVHDATPEVSAQMAYQSTVFGKQISVFTPDSVRSKLSQPLIIAPYINTEESQRLIKSIGGEVWGPPSVLVAALKNKANCHHAIDALSIEGFSTPEFDIRPIEYVIEGSNEILILAQDMYQKTGLLNQYPLGVMLRGAESDGNYGAAMVYKKGRNIVVVPDGNSSDQKSFANWDSALNAAQEHLLKGMDQTTENRVVISRLLDLADSPGMSLFISEGKVFSLGWNGQVRNPGSSACIGTSTYQPESKDLLNIQLEQEKATSEKFTAFLKQMCASASVDFKQLTCFMNVDLMIPGPFEVELQRRLGKKAEITVAEINPRITNWTDTLIYTLWAESLNKTIEQVFTVMAKGVLAVDKFPIAIPSSASMTTVREAIQEVDRDLSSQSGSHVYLRMPDMPNVGLIFTGDTKSAYQATARKLASLNQ